jgi:RNA polymerase sigma-70 factor (family 1)
MFANLATGYLFMKFDYKDEKILLDRLKSQDVNAFEFLYVNSRKRLFVLALSIVKNKAVAQDLVHEIFHSFWENRDYEKIQISVSSYLYNTTRYKAIRYLKREHSFIYAIEALDSIEESDMNFPLENSELRTQLDSAIAKLPNMAGKVFIMHYINNLSHKEIARLLKISTSTVSSHVDRALKGLREQLKKSL